MGTVTVSYVTVDGWGFDPPIPSATDDGWGGWTTHTIRYGRRMGGLPGPIRVRHPSTEKTSVHESSKKKRIGIFFKTIFFILKSLPQTLNRICLCSNVQVTQADRGVSEGLSAELAS
jgi:hypothetical protein